MVAEQAEQQPRVFISYSRMDSDFAYRLLADLEARGFDPWIDTTKLADQGGHNWVLMIENAIDVCQAMVVIMSPDAARSDNVHMEYRRLQKQKKLLIPVHFRTVDDPDVRMDIEMAQWIEFREAIGGPNSYQIGLNNLVHSLSRAPQPPRLAPLPQAPADTSTALAIGEDADMPEFQPASPAPPEPSPDIQQLIAGVYDARGRNDLVSEKYFLDRISESGDPLAGPAFADQLDAVTKQLEQQHTARLREVALESVAEKQWRRALGAWQALLTMLPDDQSAIQGIHQARVERATEALADGEYDEAVGTWQALIRLEPDAQDAHEGLRAALKARANDAYTNADWTRAAESWETLRALTPPEPHAQEYLDAIGQNQREAYRYQTAQRLLLSGNDAGAHAALEDLYRVAPWYGDRAGIAPQAHITPGKRLPDHLKEQQAPASTPKDDAEAKTVQQRKVDDYDNWRTAWLFTGLLLIPGNYLGEAIASNMTSGDQWFTLAWMSLLICAGLAIPLQALAACAGNLWKKSYWLRFNAALFITFAVLIPASWFLTLWLDTGFRHGMNWSTLLSIIGGSVFGMILVPLGLVILMWIFDS